MTKTFAALAAAATLIPTFAAAHEAPIHFTAEGKSFSYTVENAANGSQVLDGRDESTGDRFRLIVRDGMVTGSWGGRAVSFAAPKAKTPPAVQTASR